MFIRIRFIGLFFVLTIFILEGQSFYFGADLSYVNEMEDCGAVYREDDQTKDPYQIFADRGSNLVRLRLWHTPAWYDNLNQGKRYADLADVRRSIARAKAAGMAVLLDFHLSDTWADPAKQIVPAAWAEVVDNLPVLQDSLYNYVSGVLTQLDAEDLLPDMVQIGNETNRGILLSEARNNAGWQLNWDRNAPLFNIAIKAVREVEKAAAKPIEIVIHAAGPDQAEWLFGEFLSHGVTDFDIMGISYYWAWHKPVSIENTGAIIAKLRQTHPAYEVMVVETGYPWTLEANDQANNIINELHPAYSPASPANQLAWMVDLAKAVMANGGRGLIYWEPAWVSTACRTPWGQGSHQEHATFFDFTTNVIPGGGIGWMAFDYGPTGLTSDFRQYWPVKIYPDQDSRFLYLEWLESLALDSLEVQLFSVEGKAVAAKQWKEGITGVGTLQWPLPALARGVYVVVVRSGRQVVARERVWLGQ